MGSSKLTHLKPNQAVAVNSNASAKAYLKKQLKLTSGYDFQLLEQSTDFLGTTHYRFQQTFKGLPVEYKIYLLHTREGKVASANGDYINHQDKIADVMTHLSEKEALQTTINSIGAEAYPWSSSKSNDGQAPFEEETHIHPLPVGLEVIMFNEKSQQYERAWKFKIEATKPFSKHWVYVSANSGQVIKEVDIISHADHPSSGKSKYYGDVKFIANKVGTRYSLKSESPLMSTYNLNGEMDYDNATLVSHNSDKFDFEDDDMSEAVTVHYSTQLTVEYFKKYFKRNSIDNKGYELKSYINFPSQMPNAFWDGERMTYMRANGLSPVVTEVVAHEITHGLIQYTANFTQQGEASALAESFGDIMGVQVDWYRDSTQHDSNLFVSGEQLFPGGIRNLMNPGAKSNPAYYEGQNWDMSGQDGHGNSTVQSHWFYMLVRGKAGKNEAGKEYDIKGLGMKKAGMIAYLNLAYYLTPQSDHEDARAGAIQAAVDAFGACSHEVIQTTNAWAAVGVGESYSSDLTASFSYSIDACSQPKEVTFAFTGSGAEEVDWDFGDGKKGSGFNMTHTYPESGLYYPGISTTGCEGGTETFKIQSPVVIDNSDKCDTARMTSNATSTACNGILYDSGGPDEGPAENTTNTMIIQPSDVKKVSIRFTDFNMGFMDQVRVYSGTSTSGNPLGNYSFFEPPVDAVSDNEALTIQEITGSSFPGGPESTGFVANWNCEKASNPISTNFDVVTKVSVYPNPAANQLNIEISNNYFIGADWQLTSATGQVVMSGQVTSQKEQIQVESLPKGIYHLILYNQHSHLSHLVQIQ